MTAAHTAGRWQREHTLPTRWPRDRELAEAARIAGSRVVRLGENSVLYTWRKK